MGEGDGHCTFSVQMRNGMSPYLWVWILLLGWLAPLEAEISKEERRLIDVGRKRMQDHLYELAENEFKKLLAKFPESELREEATHLLARTLLGQGRSLEAMELLEAQLPTISEAWQDDCLLLLGEVQLKSELADAAFKTYESLVARFPNSEYVLDAKYGMAQALLKQQKFDPTQEILRGLQKEGRREQTLRATLSLGISFFLQKKYDQALELLARLVKEERDSMVGFQALYALGELEVARNQNNTARVHFETLTKSDHREAQAMAPSVFFRLGQIDAAASRWTDAAGNYEQAFRKSDDASFQLKCVGELTEVYLRLDKADVLAGMLNDWADDHEKARLGEALLLEVGTLWWRAGKRDQALQAFHEFFRKYPEGRLSDRAHFQFGWVLLDDKKHESAASEFQEAAAAAEGNRNPQLQADAWLKLGDLNFEQQKFAPAVTAYARAAEAKGADAAKTEQAIYQAANASFLAGNTVEVFTLQDKHRVQYPDGKLAPEFLLLAAEVYRRASEMPKAAEAYRTLLNKYPDSPHAARTWVDYAEVLYSLGEFKDTIQAINSFAEKYPRHDLIPRALLARARCLERLEQTGEAFGEFESLVKTHPKSSAAAEAQFWLGLYFDGRKDYARSQVQFELLFKNSPTHPLAPGAAYFAARAADRLGQNKDDVVRLIKILDDKYKTSPWVFDGHFLDGDIRMEQGKFEEALLIFEDLTKNYDATKTPDLAEKILEAHGQRGRCLRQLKRYKEARDAFKIIIDSPKADAAQRSQACVDLGKTHENMEDLTQALDWYSKPLYERTPQNPLPEEREFFWVCKGGLEAVRILEGQKNWKGAARVLKRIIENNLPCHEAEERLKKLQSEHPDAK